MTTNVVVILLLVAVLLVIGGLSVAHRMRERANHRGDREVKPTPPDSRPDL